MSKTTFSLSYSSSRSASSTATSKRGRAAEGGGGGSEGGTYTVSTGADDGYWRKQNVSGFGSTVYRPSSYTSILDSQTYVYMGGNLDDEDFDYDFYKGYFRFNNVNVSQGATISSAYFKPYFKNKWGTFTLRIAAYDDDDALQPSLAFHGGHSFDTTAYVDYSSSSISASSGDQITSPDIKTVIQEIVDRAGWTSGSDLMIMTYVYSLPNYDTGYMRVSGYEDTGKAAQLEINV